MNPSNWNTYITHLAVLRARRGWSDVLQPWGYWSDDLSQATMMKSKWRSA